MFGDRSEYVKKVTRLLV